MFTAIHIGKITIPTNHSSTQIYILAAPLLKFTPLILNKICCKIMQQPLPVINSILFKEVIQPFWDPILNWLWSSRDHRSWWMQQPQIVLYNKTTQVPTRPIIIHHLPIIFINNSHINRGEIKCSIPIFRFKKEVYNNNYNK